MIARMGHGTGIALAAALVGACGPAAAPRPASPPAPAAPSPPTETGPAEPAEQVPVIFLEPAAAAPAGGLPLFRPLAAGDPRLATCERLLDNEAARFIRRAIAAAERRADPGRPAGAPPPALPIVLQKGGNHAGVGYRVVVAGGEESQPGAPYVLLECEARSLSGTLLHEGGHVLHAIATRGRRPEATWTSTIHSTFAVTDPITALAEGFAIHLETLWGHYGADPDRRAFYHRLAPRFERTGNTAAEFYAPARDLQTFAQTFARYQAVRDGLPAFAGHHHPGDYLRSQYDPARDLATLKQGNAMIASEGVVASVLFWVVAGTAGEQARPGGGLDQPALAAAEARLVDALFALPAEPPGPFRPDLVDVVAAYAGLGVAEQQRVLSRFLELTRAVTVKPEVAPLWNRFYRAALTIDQLGALLIMRELERLRAEAAAAADADLAALRAGLGPVVPVRVDGVQLTLVGLGAPFPMEVDLNAAGPVEWAAMPRLSPALRQRAIAERARRPFASLADFAARMRVPAGRLGLSAVDLARSPDPEIR